VPATTTRLPGIAVDVDCRLGRLDAPSWQQDVTGEGAIAPGVAGEDAVAAQTRDRLTFDASSACGPAPEERRSSIAGGSTRAPTRRRARQPKWRGRRRAPAPSDPGERLSLEDEEGVRARD
jgi:hypothetical protein